MEDHDPCRIRVHSEVSPARAAPGFPQGALLRNPCTLKPSPPCQGKRAPGRCRSESGQPRRRWIKRGLTSSGSTHAVPLLQDRPSLLHRTSGPERKGPTMNRSVPTIEKAIPYRMPVNPSVRHRIGAPLRCRIPRFLPVASPHEQCSASDLCQKPECTRDSTLEFHTNLHHSGLTGLPFHH